MNKDKAEELINRYLNGTATPEEEALLENWYDLTALELADRPASANYPKIELEILEALRKEQQDAPIKRLWPRFAAAASILFFLSLGAYFVFHQQQHLPSGNNVIVNDVTPGSNSATLTLGNGKTIQLNAAANGKLAIQGGIVVTKTANGQLQYQQIASADDEVMINTITTKRKEQYKVILADGTSVWLNAASSIKYPTAFTGNNREVSITGEAYFEVAHNAAKPFRVTSQGQTVEVLGTHFNVNAYADEPSVKTTLLEGSVKVTANNSFRIIAPGEQSVLKQDQLSVNDADIDEAVAWKNGYFRFNKESIASIMRKLSRWYDIDVQFEGSSPDDEFTGTISRFTNISEVLKDLQYYKTVHFKVEGRRVTVSK